MGRSSKSSRKNSKGVELQTSITGLQEGLAAAGVDGNSGTKARVGRKTGFVPPATTEGSFTQSTTETYHRPDKPAPVVPRTTAREFPPPPLPVGKPALAEVKNPAAPVAEDDPTQPLLFEVAWEVCWQLGGIYTVIRTKAGTMVESWGHHYCLIGPYNADTASVEFEPAEPTGLIAEAIRRLEEMSVRAHYGYWLIDGRPRVILLDFLGAFGKLGDFKYLLWKDHGIQTADNDIDTNNVVVFGMLVGLFFQELCRFKPENRPIVAHFHEWMVGPGLMRINFLKLPVATVFTTHATLLGRYLCTDNPDFYSKLDAINPDAAAGHYGIYPRYCLERGAAHCADVFTTVSDVTALEAEKLLLRKPDVITPNGLNI